MEPPNTNPSPKTRFLQIKSCIDAHVNLVQRPDFTLALDTAEKELLWQKSTENGTANDAAANYYRLQGAHQFIRILKTLAEQPRPLPTAEPTGISHEFK